MRSTLSTLNQGIIKPRDDDRSSSLGTPLTIPWFRVERDERCNNFDH